MPLGHSKKFSKKVLRVTIYKTVLPETESAIRKDFFVWGTSDFLYADVFSSLSGLSAVESRGLDDRTIGSSALTEDRHLYLYKDEESNLFPRKAFSWIFNNQSRFPLIVISLLKAGVIDLINNTVLEQARAKNFEFDVFKTIGNGTQVLVFRSAMYEPILQCLVELNTISQNTYSIAGVQNPLSNKSVEDVIEPIFIRKLRSSRPENDPQAFVSIDYMLKNNDGTGRRIGDIIAQITSLFQKALEDFQIHTEHLSLEIFLLIGRYDLEIRLKGYTSYILELLLNPEYGLANLESSFYDKYIFESRTTWQSPWASDLNIET